ncbi:GNAT family N-acetyltransferase [Pontibacillus sp. HMF3514]|uniref:GNAT family N-acetyltransferase n=1 Tax=Pontibacillus sp. HMF3514 TaxID=2692425 RepID=UPI00131FD964|nr:GNAT family N-acetyltransferase [Pontibacillus sp. HMF3514]QHE51000.1 hypothetical protein GS400_02620 [Pontibacillus sp. HMF3514]
MSMILKDASKEQLIQANQRSLLAFNKEMSNDSDVVHYLQRDQVEGLYSLIPVEFLNRVILTKLSSDHFEKKLLAIKDFYIDKSSPLSWEIWPTDSPDNMEEKLKQNKFQYSRDYPAMSVRVNHIVEEPLGNLVIRKVKNQTEAEVFADVFQEVYGLPDSIREDFLSTVKNKGYDRDLLNYVGYVQGEPVCVSTFYYAAGVAGIYNVGTKKEHSRKGYGRKITAYPLLEAKKQGYEYAILQSSVQGEKVYARMGFDELCRVKVYKSV